MKFEVYIVRDESGEIVYIGEGRSGRSRHVNSGVSNIYKLNEGHFDGVVWDIEVIKYPTKAECFDSETELIKLHNPKYNTHKTERHAMSSSLHTVCRTLKARLETGGYHAEGRSMFLHGLSGGEIQTDGTIKINKQLFKKNMVELAQEYCPHLSLDQIYTLFIGCMSKNLMYFRIVASGWEKRDGKPNDWYINVNWDIVTDLRQHENIIGDLMFKK